MSFLSDEHSDTEEVEDNIIVKLNSEGFFEEVRFQNDEDYEVEINSNPLALEVFGTYSLVIFEVD